MPLKYNQLMKKCIKLARKGEGKVSPNPLVGCIIFDDDYRVISEGYHEKYGLNHAERNAILNSKEDVKGKNLIVNLEPCSHFGKTPPCVDLIIEKGIKKVIVGHQDPNPIVSGKGIKKLKDNGIEVVIGVLEKECKDLNKIFIKNQTQNKPYITIKTATTLDGKIATKTGNSKWITDEVSRKEVQKLRNSYDAILTSSQTVIKDNPSMTCRLKNGKTPIRVVLDTKLITSCDSKIYNDDGIKVFIAVSKKLDLKDKMKKFPKHVEFIICDENQDGHIDINKVIELLYKKGINSILVEAGARLNNAFIQAKCVDCLIQFIAPKILADKMGTNWVEGCSRNYIKECNNLNIISTKLLKNDIILVGYFYNS